MVRHFISSHWVWQLFWGSAKDDNACGFITPKVEIILKDSVVCAYLSQRGPVYPTGHSSQINPRLRSKWHVGLKLCWCCWGTTGTRKKHIHKVISGIFSSLSLQYCCDKKVQAGHSRLADRDQGLASRGWNDIAISADVNIAQWRAISMWHVINWLLTVLGLCSSVTSGTVLLLFMDSQAWHNIASYSSSPAKSFWIWSLPEKSVRDFGKLSMW